jgi:hypothetical protein
LDVADRIISILAAAAAFRFGGLAVVGPLYFIANGLENYLSPRPNPRQNIVPLSVARALPKILFACIAITSVLISGLPGMALGASSGTSQYILAAFIQTLPVLPSLLIRLSSMATFAEAGKSMKGHVDVESLQAVYPLTGLVSAIVHGCNVLYGVSIHKAQSDNASEARWVLETLLGASGLNGELRSTYVYFTVAALLWVLWSCRLVIPAESRTVLSTLKLVLAVGACVVMVGPGATASFFWLWREDKTRCDKAAGVKFVNSLNRAALSTLM